MSGKNSVVQLLSESNGQAEEDTIDTSLGLSAGDLGAVQDILYGRQLRATNNLIEQLQKTMQMKFEELSMRLDSRIAEVEVTVETNQKSSLKLINDRDKAHAASVAGIHKKLDGSESSFENKIHIAIESAQTGHAKVSSDLKECKKTLSTSIKSTREELESALKLASKDLDDRKLDRDALSGLLGGLAGQLSKVAVGVDDSKHSEKSSASVSTKK